MSTLGINSNTTTPTAPTGTLSSLSGGSPVQITGLASGLNTNQIITEMMSLKQQPVTILQNQETGITARNAQLTNIQTKLQALATDAQALSDPALFSNTQTVTSSQPTAVSASTSTGAGVGGYQVGVSQLANSSQRTFTFASPAAADTVTIDGHPTALAAGATAQDFAAAINSDSTATVYAAATDAGTVVLSSRNTGNTGTNFIQTSDTAGAVTEQTSLARQGQDAQYTIGGVSGSSHSNTVTGAIAGVTLTLNALTTTLGSATVNVSAPAPSAKNITAAVQTFVNDYNAAIAQISTQITQTPSSSDPTQGTLFGDKDLTGLLSTMRNAMYGSGSGVSNGMSSLFDIGVSTGATSGAATPSASALAGVLTINQATLTSAISSNSVGVQQMLQGFSTSFASLVKNESQPGGTIASRIQGDSSQIANLTNQISGMQASLADQQAQLTQQFATLESVLSQNQSEATWLNSAIASLPTP